MKLSRFLSLFNTFYKHFQVSIQIDAKCADFHEQQKTCAEIRKLARIEIAFYIIVHEEIISILEHRDIF